MRKGTNSLGSRCLAAEGGRAFKDKVFSPLCRCPPDV